MLNPEYSFEKTDLFSTPIWTSEFTEIDNNKIKDFLYRMQEDDQNNSSDEERRKWEYVWESGYCQLDSYKDILTLNLIVTLSLIGCIPFLFKLIFNRCFSKRKNT